MHDRRSVVLKIITIRGRPPTLGRIAQFVYVATPIVSILTWCLFCSACIINNFKTFTLPISYIVHIIMNNTPPSSKKKRKEKRPRRFGDK